MAVPTYDQFIEPILRCLVAMGLVRHHEGTGLAAIRRDYKDRDERFDLKRYFYVTANGVEYLKLRSELEGSEPDPDVHWGSA